MAAGVELQELMISEVWYHFTLVSKALLRHVQKRNFYSGSLVWVASTTSSCMRTDIPSHD
eukprot:scaffold227763_cov47-Prasinocladus_malaysianus.AAC.2